MTSGSYLYGLSISGVLSESRTCLLVNTPINKNEKLDSNASPNDGQQFVYFVCTYSDFEIQAGSTFIILFDKKAKKKLKMNFTLVKVYLGYPHTPPLDSVPRGWKSICKFSVSEEDLAIVKTKLPKIDGFDNSTKFELRKYEE